MDYRSNSNVPSCCSANSLSRRIEPQFGPRDHPNIETYQGSSGGLGCNPMSLGSIGGTKLYSHGNLALWAFLSRLYLCLSFVCYGKLLHSSLLVIQSFLLLYFFPQMDQQRYHLKALNLQFTVTCLAFYCKLLSKE